uniref:Uncharacterized protein n=1 Tax=Anguilla anguilla TaxID=7936 RepID=A0A0E9RVP0_ANGAN
MKVILIIYCNFFLFFPEVLIFVKLQWIIIYFLKMFFFFKQMCFCILFSLLLI